MRRMTTQLQESTPAAAGAARHAAPTGLSAVHALLVDDDTVALALVRAQLLAAGLGAVTCVESAREARESLSADPAINLIICDLQMPGEDGVQMLRSLANEGCGLPLVILSGSDGRLRRSVETLARRYRLAILGSLHKPLSVPALTQLLEQPREEVLQRNCPARRSTCCPQSVERVIDQHLHLHYQPKVDLRDGNVHGFEALLRIGEDAPCACDTGTLVQSVEQLGLADRLTGRVFELAARDMQRWQEQGLSVRVAVNVSAANLCDLDLPETFARSFLRRGIDPGNVVLELTETAVIDDVALSLDVLTRLRLQGAQLALDDYGSGYASLEKLTEMPFNEVKLDRAFILGARRSADTLKVLHGAVRMARELGLDVVAEGVETADDLELVRASGCDRAQGYLFSRAVPPARVPALRRFDLQARVWHYEDGSPVAA
jgi:EAL domain-containing protein (putative c-di-GMP-specific phosphodiesterase class I)